MKKFIVAAMCCLFAFGAQAQSLGDLFNKVKNGGSTEESNGDNGNGLGDILGGLAETILSSTGIVKTDITGNWTYAKADCKFTSEDLAKQAGGVVVAAKVSDMLNNAYTKIGIKTGAFHFTFNADGSFVLSLGKKDLKGDYVLEGNDLKLNYKTAKGLKAASVNAHIQKAGDNLSILFNADKLLTLVGQIASVANVASLKTVAELVKGYDGMMIGFEMNRE